MTIKQNLYETNIKYSNFFNTFSINSACESLLQAKYITSPKVKKVLHKYKMNNITNTNCNNIVTIDNGHSSQPVNSRKLVRYDGVLDPDKHYSATSDSYCTPSIFPRMDFNIYSSNILPCTPLRNSLSNSLITGSSINVITVPPKFWKKKAVNKYDPILYDDVDEDVYVQVIRQEYDAYPSFCLILSFEAKLSTNLNFNETFI